MKRELFILIAVLLGFFCGCTQIVEEKRPIKTDENLLTVDFQQGQTLRYKFVSTRNITVNYESTKKKSKPGRSKSSKFFESVEMIVSYTPTDIDPYGLTTISAKCESVKVKRTARKGRRGTARDAVESLAGKTFTFTVDPVGKIADASELDKLIQQAGAKSFRTKNKRGKIKESDMVGDFIATQWFLWDTVSSMNIADAINGVEIGQKWNSKLFIPVPMMMRKARDVTYTLDGIRDTEKGRIAVIKETFSASKSVPTDWPKPYPAGRFQMKGTFGFYINYKITDLHGTGEELFNIDSGRIERYNQNYEMQLQASLLIPLSSVKPRIVVKQNLTMQLIGN